MTLGSIAAIAVVRGELPRVWSYTDTTAVAASGSDAKNS